jgi:ribosomal 50S subunit-recycling heat shock protein
MAIAEVKSVINSCFINGSSAYVGQTIDYGDLIETYNISIGLLESKLSSDTNNDGILTIQFIEKEEKMRIKPHCRVIFQAGDRGLWAGPNTVGLSVESRVFGRPTNPPQLGNITLPLGKVYINGKGTFGVRSAKPNEKIFSGDIITTQGKSRAEIKTKKGEKFRTHENVEFLASPETFDKAKKVGGNVSKKDLGWLATAKVAFGTQKRNNVRGPTSISAIRG